MTSHAQRRRNKLAAQLKVQKRTAANIFKTRVAEKRGESKPTQAEKVEKPGANIRHFFLKEETDYEVEVPITLQTIAHFTMGGGALTNSGTKNRKFGWFSSWGPSFGMTRAGWVVREDHLGPEWEPTERELHDLAAKALADELLKRFKYVIVIHAPDKVAMLASDLPFGTEGMKAVPRQPITEGPSPSWWPDGTGRPDIKDPDPVPVDEGQERDFGSLVLALDRADGQVSIEMSKLVFGESTDHEPIRTAIKIARGLLSQVRNAAVTPRQKKLAKRAVEYENHWNRNEASINRMDAFDRGILLPIR